MLRKAPRDAGFTAIELLTVLVIIGIGAAVAAPNISAFVHKTRTQQALNQVVTDVARARLMAVEDGRKAALVFQTDGTYYLQTQATDGTWSTVQTVRLRDDFTGVSIQGDMSSLEFSTRGMVTNLAGDAYLRILSNGARDSVFVSPAGRAYRAF